MAGSGPAPKLPDERRNRTPPSRGEWVDLEPLETPILPELPRRSKGEGPWPATTRAVWEAWRADPVTSQYTVADIAYALDTIRLHAVMTPASASEIRLRMDALGLTPKGKRDLRWRVVEDAPKAEQPRTPAKTSRRRARLSVVK